MAVLFELTNKRIAIKNPVVTEIMENTLNYLCNAISKGEVPYPITPEMLSRSSLLDEVADYVMNFIDEQNKPMSYCQLACIVGDIILELKISPSELDAKLKGKWFKIIPNNLYEYTVA